MLLILTAPRIAARDCSHCQKYQYEEAGPKAGEVATLDGKPLFRRGPTPCRQPQGCPKGTPEAPKTLSRRNWIAYNAYLEYKAVGQFPDDPIVRRNAGIIRQVEDQVARTEQAAFSSLRSMS